jgi:hypothetical protein
VDLSQSVVSHAGWIRRPPCSRCQPAIAGPNVMRPLSVDQEQDRCQERHDNDDHDDAYGNLFRAETSVSAGRAAGRVLRSFIVRRLEQIMGSSSCSNRCPNGYVLEGVQWVEILEKQYVQSVVSRKFNASFFEHGSLGYTF